MRKKVQIQITDNENDKTEIWLQHLIQYIIIEQLNVPHRIQAKLIYQTFKKGQK